MPLRGQGEHGENGGSPGDLYIRINVAKSKQFDRRGNDIYIDTHISMGKAALGVEITVPTVDGDVKYTIPAGTQSGTMFRLKGKGVPKVHSNTRGDQYVKVIVDTPKNLNSKQKEALEAFMEATGEAVDGEHSHTKKDLKIYLINKEKTVKKQYFFTVFFSYNDFLIYNINNSYWTWKNYEYRIGYIEILRKKYDMRWRSEQFKGNTFR